MSICFLSLEISKVFNELILKKLEEEGFDNLSASLITIFPFIEEYKNISISSLAQKLGYSRQAMHKNLKKLESSSYITLEQLKNKKERVVLFSKRGDELMAVANSFMQSIQEELYSQIGKEDINNFVKTQQKIFEILNSKA